MSPPMETAIVTQGRSRHSPGVTTIVLVTKGKNEQGIPGELISVTETIEVINPPSELPVTEEETSERLRVARIEAKRIVRYDDVQVSSFPLTFSYMLSVVSSISMSLPPYPRNFDFP
jgi:hypothetical protein